MKRKGKRTLHQMPPGFAEAAEHKAVQQRYLETVPAWERAKEAARLNPYIHSTNARTMPHKRHR